MLFDTTVFIGLLVIIVTGVLFFALRHPRVNTVFVRSIPDRPQRRLFLASIAFFLTFAGVRLVTYSNHHHLGPFHDIYFHGRHIHHLVWGILSCCWWATDGWLRRVLAISRLPFLPGACFPCFTVRELRLRWMSSLCGLISRMSIGRVKAAPVLMP